MKLRAKSIIPLGHPYLSNKYTQWYYDIIDHARNRSGLQGYFERHHIIPRSLGGPNTKPNLVNLTAREHYVAHLLLVRMTEGNAHIKMLHAAWAMSIKPKKQHDYKVNSRLFATLKEQIAKIKSELNKGRTLSDETRKKQSIAHTGRKKSPEHIANLAASQKGKKLKPESIAKRTATRMAKGNYAHTEEYKAARRGRKQSPESNAKRSATLTGRKQSPESNQKRSIAHKGVPKKPEHSAKCLASRIRNGNHRRTPESIAKGLATKAANKLKKEQGT
jgi:hypothetical protein